MPKRILPLIIWSILGIAGLLVFILFFNHAFPIASIDIKLSKEEVYKKANDFIVAQGFDLKDFDKTLIFSSDDDASAYLQKTQGIKKSNELIHRGIPVWFWRARWFKELKKEGFYVDVDPSTGDIVQFYYSVLDDEKGADLAEPQAKTIAERVISLKGIDLKDYELKDSTTKKQKQRTDYHFSWEKKNYKIKDATLRIDVDISGDKLGRFIKYLKVPEEFNRELEKEVSFGTMLSLISSIFIFLLIVAAIFTLVVQHKQSKVNWKFGLFFGGIVALLLIFTFLNSMPLLWSVYPDTVSKAIFITLTLGGTLISALMTGLIIFLYGSSGESLSSQLWQTKMPLFSALKNKKYVSSQIMPIFIVGYSLGFIFLGYVTLFYLIGTRFFNIWMPASSTYSNILGTAMPFLFPLTVATTAALSEEFMFRLFAISFFKKYFKITWLAVLISALIWAFGHSEYPIFPTYVRGTELTIFGIILGTVFLKYGLETVIIAHYLIDALLVGLPLLRSHNLYFIISGLIVIMLALLPILLLVVMFPHDKTKGLFPANST